MNAKEIKTEIYQSGYIECHENCPYDRVCANHKTAGDFRFEDGFAPKLSLHSNVIKCETFYEINNGEEYYHWPKTIAGIGAVKIKDIQEVVNTYDI